MSDKGNSQTVGAYRSMTTETSVYERDTANRARRFSPESQVARTVVSTNPEHGGGHSDCLDFYLSVLGNNSVWAAEFEEIKRLREELAKGASKSGILRTL